MTAAKGVAAGGGVTDALRLAAGHRPPGGITYELRVRLGTFLALHPGIDIHQGGGREWYASIPLGDDERYDSGHLHDPDLARLLDKLDEHLGPPG